MFAGVATGFRLKVVSVAPDAIPDLFANSSATFPRQFEEREAAVLTSRRIARAAGLEPAHGVGD